MVEAAGGVPLAAPTPKKTFLDLKTMDTISQQFGLYWPNFIAQVILFVIVYFVLRKYAFRPIVTMLEERRRRIEEGQLNAERIKKQLAEAQAKYQEILRKANEQGSKLIEEARISNE